MAANKTAMKDVGKVSGLSIGTGLQFQTTQSSLLAFTQISFYLIVATVVMLAKPWKRLYDWQARANEVAYEKMHGAQKPRMQGSIRGKLAFVTPTDSTEKRNEQLDKSGLLVNSRRSKSSEKMELLRGGTAVLLQVRIVNGRGLEKKSIKRRLLVGTDEGGVGVNGELCEATVSVDDFVVKPRSAKFSLELNIGGKEQHFEFAVPAGVTVPESTAKIELPEGAVRSPKAIVPRATVVLREHATDSDMDGAADPADVIELGSLRSSFSLFAVGLFATYLPDDKRPLSGFPGLLVAILSFVAALQPFYATWALFRKSRPDSSSQTLAFEVLLAIVPPKAAQALKLGQRIKNGELRNIAALIEALEPQIAALKQQLEDDVLKAVEELEIEVAPLIADAKELKADAMEAVASTKAAVASAKATVAELPKSGKAATAMATKALSAAAKKKLEEELGELELLWQALEIRRRLKAGETMLEISKETVIVELNMQEEITQALEIRKRVKDLRRYRRRGRWDAGRRAGRGGAEGVRRADGQGDRQSDEGARAAAQQGERQGCGSPEGAGRAAGRGQGEGAGEGRAAAGEGEGACGGGAAGGAAGADAAPRRGEGQGGGGAGGARSGAA